MRELQAAGQAGALAQHAAAAERSLIPVQRDWLIDRLSTMQLAMTQGWSEAKATAWLNETTRLLNDLPRDIVDGALDQAVKASERGFVPSVGAIRSFADPKLADRQRIAARLRALVNFDPDAPRAPERPWEDIGNIARRIATPEEVAAIKEDLNFATQPYPEPVKPRGPLREPTAADYAEVAKVMGIDLTKPAPVPDFDPTGMTIEQIQAKVEANRAERARQLVARPAGAVPLEQRPMPDWDEMERYGS